MLEEELMGLAISIGVHQDGTAGSAVTPGASDLLVVSFQTAWKCGVDHGADVSLVDSHAKGNRRHDHLDLAPLKLLLDLPSAGGIDSGVIRSRREVGSKFHGQAFGLLARGCVDDCRSALGFLKKLAGEFGSLRRRGLDNLNCQVVAAKSVNEALRLRQAQLLDDIVLNDWCGSRG
jgi:hypothetical protein